MVAETVAGNWGSRRVLEKSGLSQVAIPAGTAPDPADGAEHGLVIYELSRADWEARARRWTSAG